MGGKAKKAMVRVHSSILPNAALDEGTMQAMLIIARPGVKKGKKSHPL